MPYTCEYIIIGIWINIKRIWTRAFFGETTIRNWPSSRYEWHQHWRHLLETLSIDQEYIRGIDDAWSTRTKKTKVLCDGCWSRRQQKSTCDCQMQITSPRIVRPWSQKSSCRHAVFSVVDHGIRTQITSDVYQNSEWNYVKRCTVCLHVFVAS